MQEIHQNSETINYQQNKMNIQEEKDLFLYNKKNADIPPQYFQPKEQPYYNDDINTTRRNINQSDMRINEPGITKTKVPTYTDTSEDIGTHLGTYGHINKNIDIGGYKETYTDIRTATPISTHETLSAYVPTKENLHLSHQSLDTCNHDMINSKETVENLCFEKINKIHERNKYDTTDKQLIEKDALQHSYYYDYNTFECIDPNKEKTYSTNHTEQQIDTYQNLTNIENQIYPMKSQQIISENVQHFFPDTYKNNIHITSAQSALTTCQKNIPHDIQNQEQQQHHEAIIHIQNKQDESEKEEVEKEKKQETEEIKKEKTQENKEMIEQENYKNSCRQMKYYLQQNENNCDYSKNTHEKQNNCEPNIVNGTMNYRLGINEQELAAFYTQQYTEQNKQEPLNMYESYNNTLQAYLHKPNYLNGNNGDRPIQTHNINHHLGTVQHSEESYNQLEQFEPYMQNSTSTRTYENASSVMNTEKNTNTNEINDGTEENIRENSAEPLDSIMETKTINNKVQSLNIGHSFLQQQQQQNIREFSQHTINQDKHDASNTQEQYVTQNASYYSNIPAEINISANTQSPKNTMNTLSIDRTVDMQSRLTELNSMPRMNYNSLMFQHSQHFNKKQTQSTLSENEYLNIHMNEQYSAKDIKEFMLEPKLLTKMDLDMPEIIDGLTTVQGDKGETNLKKETIMKYKDTWRLIPGKSLNINQNESTNQRESKIQLFQQYLDRSNEKTQQMLLNSTFNSLTGRLSVNPFVNNQELDNSFKIYNYKHPAAAFPNSYYQPKNSLTNNKTSPNTLYPTSINEVNNEHEWKFYGTKQFISTKELQNVQGVNHVKMLNKITGADQVNAINNIESMSMNVANDSHFSIDIPENTDSLLNATTNMSEAKQLQKPPKKRTLKKSTLPLCGNNMLTYDIKTYIAQTMQNYFKRKPTN